MESTIFLGNGFNNLSPNAKSWKDLLFNSIIRVTIKFL